jgi:hypothetical protein
MIELFAPGICLSTDASGLTTVNVGYGKQATDAESIEDEHGERVDPHPPDLPLWPENQACSVDAGQ